MDDIIVRYVADTSDIERRLKAIETEMGVIGDEAVASGKKTERAMKGVDDSAKKSTDTFKNLGTAIIAAFAVQRVISFTREMSNLGVQLETTAQRMRVVFGGAAKDVERQSKQMAQSLGLSVNQFNLMASQVGDVLVPLGLARDEAAGMSTEAVKLAGALSEFSAGQVDTEQAVHALIGAFTGEREALKTLGVVINEADLQARLAQKGQKNLQGQALATAKAYATFELILERSADAQTFFTENADSAARTQAELTAQTQTLREELARKLTPVINSATKTLVNFVGSINADQLINFGKAIAVIGTAFITYKIVNRITELAQAFKALTVSSGIGLAISAFTTIASAVGLFQDELLGTNKEIEETNRLSDNLADIQKKAKQSTDAEIGSLRTLTEQIKRAKNSSQERKNLIDQLNEQYGTTLKNLEDEEEFTRQLEENYEAIVSKIKEKIAIQSQEEQLNAIYAERQRVLEPVVSLLRRYVDLNDLASSLGKVGIKDLSEEVENMGDVIEILTSAAQKGGEGLSILEKRVLNFIKTQTNVNQSGPFLELIQQLAQVESDAKTTFENTQAIIDSLGLLTTGGGGGGGGDKKKKKEQETQDEINKVIQKANEKMFKESLEALEDEFKIRKRMILDDATLTETERQKALESLETEYFADRIDTYQAFAMQTVDIELEAAIRRNEIRNKEAEEEKKRKEKEAEDSKKLEEYKRQLQADTRQAFINTANIILDISKQLGDDSLGLAIFQVLLNKAVAASEAVKAALAGAAKAGVGAPVVAPLLIAQLTGIVLSSFGEINSLITQAEQSRQSARRFARGGIMIQGDGSSTGDSIHALISPRESIINAGATRKHYEELLAINTGTFDRLVKSKYIIPALNKQAMKQSITVDSGFSDERIYNGIKRANTEEAKRHRELIKTISSRQVRRKKWY